MHRSAPQAFERVGQVAQRGLRGIGFLGGQRRMAAGRAGIEEITGHQSVAARGDGFRPVTGGAGVDDGGLRNGHVPGGLLLNVKYEAAYDKPS